MQATIKVQLNSDLVAWSNWLKIFVGILLQSSPYYHFIDSVIKYLFVQEIRRRGLKVAVVGIPKAIDNDIPVIPLPLEITELCFIHFWSYN